MAGAVTKEKPKLRAVTGPAEGQEWELDGEELVLGRAADNAVSIPDTSVSRKHAILRRTDAGWALSDLGSGNGTMLNGEPLEDETVLKDEDVVGMGDTELKYVASKRQLTGVRAAVRGGTGTAAALRSGGRVRTARMRETGPEVAERRKRMAIIIGASGLVMLMIFGVVKAVQHKRGQENARQEKRRLETIAEFERQFQEAKDLIRAGKWVDAKTRLEDLQANAPEYEPTSVKSYIERADKEMPNEKFMDEAETALTARRIKVANDSLEKVRKATTIQRDRFSKLEAKLVELINDRTVEAKGLQSKTGERDAMVKMKEAAEDVLTQKAQGDKELEALVALADKSIARIDNPNLPAETPATPHVGVMNKYRDGDLTGATLLARQCASKSGLCKKLEAQIGEAQTKFSSVESLPLKDMKALYELDRQIAGGQSSDHSKPLRLRLASQLFNEASKYKTSRQWVKAITIARDIKEIDPAHAGAQQIIQDGKEASRQMYLRCYQLKDSDPDEAINICKEVMQITPPDDEYHQKAKDWVQRLQAH